MASKNVLFAKHVSVLKNTEDPLHRKGGKKKPNTENENALCTEDFMSVCRTCLNRGKLVPIFPHVTQEKTEDSNPTIVRLLKESATIQVTQLDDLPQNICRTCLVKLKKIYGFQKQCVLNESLLKSVVVKSSNQWNQNQPNSLTKSLYCDLESSEIEDNPDGEDSQNYRYLEPYCDSKSPLRKKLDEPPEKVASAGHNFKAHAHQEALKESHYVDCATSLEQSRGRRKTCTSQDRTGTIASADITEDKADPQLPYLCDSIFAAQKESNDTVLDEAPKPEDQKIFENEERRVDTAEKTAKENISNEKTKEFKCTKCVLTFKTREDYLNHRRVAKHTKNPLSKCEMCSKLVLKCNLRLHMRTHSKEKPYECEICLWKFKQKGNLKRHMKKHNRVKPHVCDLCGRGFIHSVSLDNHKKKNHEHTTTNDPLVPRPSPYNFTCEFCGRFFKRKDPMVQHLRRHHSDRIKQDKAEVESSEEKRYTCNVCHKSFKYQRGLKVHKLTHGEKQTLCNVCGKSLSTQHSLKAHLRIHTGERPYTCTICQRSFTKKTTLDLHMNTHLGVRPYGCEVCGKRFAQHQHLTAHSRIHTGERPFACSFCGKSFALKSNMRVHERTHTGELPYICEVCGKGFIDCSTRSKHRKHNHGGSKTAGDKVNVKQKDV